MDLIFLPQKRRPFSVEVGFFDTVLEIKQKVEKYQGIPISEQTFVFNNRALPDDGDIASCVLLHNSCINLVIAEARPSCPSEKKVHRLNVKIATPKKHVVIKEMNTNDTFPKAETTLSPAKGSPVLRQVQDRRSFGE